ncbi:MAG: DNA recombination protein RmuC [Bacteroidota bacterium]
MEALLYILAGVAAGSLLTYFITRSWLTAAHSSELIEKTSEQTGLREQIAALKARAESDAESLKKVQETMLTTFNAAAAAALGQNNRQFLDLAKTQIEAQSKEYKGTLEEKEKSIDKMLKPVTEAIDSYKKRIEELEKGSKETFGSLTAMLTNLQTTNTNLQKETGALVSALKNPQSRGRWGEIGLRNLVEYAGMLEHCDFNEQVYREGDEAAIKPDMVINLPDEKHVVVDSKVPLKAYMEATESQDDRQRTKLLTDHAKAVKERVNELSRKQYYEQFTNTPDLVVLFMPIESALNAALTTDKDLLQYSIEKKVILATPTTLLVVLKSFALIWQQHNMTENAIEIINTAKELHERLSIFSEHLSRIGSGLEGAVESYNKAIASYEGRILVTGRKLEELDAKSQKDNLKNIGPVDGSIRSLNKPGE